MKTAQDHGAPLRLVEATVAVNDARKRAMARKVMAAAGGNLRGKTIAVLGLTFKPNTDDIREAPALTIIQALQDAGATIRAHDPQGMDAARPLLPGIVFANSAYEAAEGASALVIITEWDAFRALDLARLRQSMARAVLVDLRNIYKREEVERAGFAYASVGRPASRPLEPLLEAAE